MRTCGGLVAYLFGPGRHNEHTDQHVVAHWTGLPGEVVAVGADGQPDLGPLVADLKADLRAAGLLGAADTRVALLGGDPGRATGRCATRSGGRSLRRSLRRSAWRTPIAGAVRWVAVRHGLSSGGNDHIHLVATLAGRTQHGDVADRTFLNRDYAQVRAVCNRFEKEWGLTVTGAGTGAAHHEPSRAETEIAARRGLRTEQRVRLERAVRTAAVASGGPAEFAARLAEEGITVTFTRESEQRPGTWLGVTFHTEDYIDAGGRAGGVLGAHVGPGPDRTGVAGPVGRPRHRAAGGPTGDTMRGLVDALAAAAQAPARAAAGRPARADRRARGRAVGGGRRGRG